MGIGPFMPSSHRHYAVDFDDDGKRDLFANPVMPLGVANYCPAPLALGGRWSSPPDRHQRVPCWHPEPELAQRLAELAVGHQPATRWQPDTPVKLLAFEQAEGPEYWVARHNFT